MSGLPIFLLEELQRTNTCWKGQKIARTGCSNNDWSQASPKKWSQKCCTIL